MGRKFGEDCERDFTKHSNNKTVNTFVAAVAGWVFLTAGRQHKNGPKMKGKANILYLDSTWGAYMDACCPEKLHALFVARD